MVRVVSNKCDAIKNIIFLAKMKVWIQSYKYLIPDGAFLLKALFKKLLIRKRKLKPQSTIMTVTFSICPTKCVKEKAEELKLIHFIAINSQHAFLLLLYHLNDLLFWMQINFLSVGGCKKSQKFISYCKIGKHNRFYPAYYYQKIYHPII